MTRAVAIALLASVTACAQPQTEEHDETAVFDEPVAVFLLADSAALAAARQEHGGEDFYVVADDMNWYRSEAADWLERNGIRTVFLQGRPPLSFVVEGKPVSFDFGAETTLDVVVLYRPGRAPVGLATVEVPDQAPVYFGSP